VNLIVLEPGDFVGEDRVRLVDRRLVHARKHLRVSPGDRLRVGLLDEGEGPAAANLGVGEVLRCDREALELRVELGELPPLASALTLALALPRPPTLAKVLQQGTAMGIKRFVLFHSRRVEKSYWDASALAPAALRRELILGLEQSVDTVLPRVELVRRFLPFVEDRLAELRARGPVLVGDPEAAQPCPRALAGEACLVLGPEGGFVPFERERFAALGDTLVSLGPRILRVETAAIALLARLAPDGESQ
jgi:16S rRNA (uracil1498-N3)-methyltransferase